MTALRDRTYRRLEGDVVSAVYRRWGFRRDLIDDLVQIGRLALAAEIDENPALPDSELCVLGIARANGDIRDYLRSRAVADGDIRLVERRINQILARPRRPRRRTAILTVRLPASDAENVINIASTRNQNVNQFLQALIRREIAGYQ